MTNKENSGTIVTSADIEKIKQMMSKVTGVTNVDVQVIVMVHTEVEGSHQRSNAYEIETEVMKAMPGVMFDFITSVGRGTSVE